MTGFSSVANYSRVYPTPISGKKFKLNRPLDYKSMDGAEYCVPAEFPTDLGSIPRWLWWYIPRDFRPECFILHDYLCNADWISRSDANKLLYEALKLSHCPDWKASAIYWACQAYAFVMRIK